MIYSQFLLRLKLSLPNRLSKRAVLYAQRRRDAQRLVQLHIVMIPGMWAPISELTHTDAVAK